MPFDEDNGYQPVTVNDQKLHNLVGSFARSSRFFALFAIAGTALSAFAIFIYAAIFVFKAVWDTFTAGMPSEEGLKHLTLHAVEATDAFLLGTVLYIVSIGFVQLFIDADLHLPTWMRITNLDQLKSKLIGVVVVLLGVTFLGNVTGWQGDDSIIYLGGAIALVLAGLAYFGFRAHEDH